MRNFAIVLGDQLNEDSAVFDGFDRMQDLIWMAEVGADPAMRQFEQKMIRRGYCVYFQRLPGGLTLRAELLRSIRRFRPERIVVVEPREEWVREELEGAAAESDLPLEVRGVAWKGIL